MQWAMASSEKNHISVKLSNVNILVHFVSGGKGAIIVCTWRQKGIYERGQRPDLASFLPSHYYFQYGNNSVHNHDEIPLVKFNQEFAL